MTNHSIVGMDGSNS